MLETNINSATDLCTNRAEDAIDTGCSVISKNFSSYFFEWERNMYKDSKRFLLLCMEFLEHFTDYWDPTDESLVSFLV